MTQLLSRTGLRSQQFGQHDVTLPYEAGELMIYNGNVYKANDAIPANTPFLEGTVGQTWSKAVVGAAGLSGNLISDGTSNVAILGVDAEVAISVDGNANIVLVTGTGANVDGTLDVTGNVTVANITANGKVDLGKVADIKIANGSNGQVLSTDGSGNLSWVSVSSSSISKGNSNVVTSNSSVTISANNQANVITVTSNGTHASSVISNDVTITGNLTIQGDTITTNVTNQAIQDAIIDLGVGANNTPLTSDDGRDRGIAMHTYGAGVVATVAVEVPLGDTIIELADLTGINVGMEVGDDATSNYIPHGTRVIAVNTTNIEIDNPTTGIIPVGEELAIGLDIVSFFGYDVSASQFVAATDAWVETDGTVTVNTLGNVRVGTLVADNVEAGNLNNGQANIVINLGGDIKMSPGGVANVLSLSGAVSGGPLNYTSTADSLSGTSTITLSSVEQLAVGQSVFSGGITQTSTTISAINGKVVTLNKTLSADALTGTTFAIGVQPSAATVAGNLTVKGHTTLGYVEQVTLKGGTSGQVLSTDGSGNLSWASVSGTSITNGSSNVVVKQDANVNISSAGVANVLIVEATQAATVTKTLTAASLSGATTITLDSVTNLAVGQVIVGGGIPAATTISSISGKTVTLSAALTAGMSIGDSASVDTDTSKVYVTDELDVGGVLRAHSITNLGPAGNVTITGGANGHVLRTDGSGNLSWASVDALASGGGTSISNGDSKVDIPTANGNVVINVNGNATNQVVVTDTRTYLNASALYIADPVPTLGDGTSVSTPRGLGFPTWVQTKSTTTTSAASSGQTVIPVSSNLAAGTTLFIGDRITSSTVPSAFAANTVVVTANATTVTISPALIGTLTSGASLQVTTPKTRFIGYDYANAEFATLVNIGSQGDNNTINFNDGYANFHAGKVTASELALAGGSNGQFLKTDGAGNLTWANVSADKIYSGNSNVEVAANANITISSNGVANIITISATPEVIPTSVLSKTVTIDANLVISNVANLRFAGGNSGEFLSTDGSSNLSWAKASYGELTTESFTATANQTDFVLAETPSGSVTMSINGATMKAAAVTISGATATYVPAQNSSYALRAGDVVTFTYQYGVTSTTLLSGISGLNINNPAQDEVLAYDAATSKWINAPLSSSGTYSLISNGTSKVQATASGNVNTSVGGVPNVFVVTNSGAHVHGTLDVSGDTVLAGNLTVQGITTTTTAASLSIENPIISEGSGVGGAPLTTNDGKDRGLLQYYYTTAPVQAFMGWKNAESEFIFASNVSNSGDIITVNTYGNVRAYYHVGTGVNVSGGVTGATLTGALTTQAQPNVTSLGTLNNLTSQGTVNFTNASNVTLGPVGNVHITGGSSGQVLRTDGSGTLSWVSISSSAISNGNSNVSVATSNGNVTINAVGNTVMTVTGTGANVSGTANISGNVATANLKVTGQANITANLLVGTFANITGNINGAANLTITDDANIGGELIVSGNANVSGAINGGGNVTFTGSNVSLGAIGNLHITGGTNSQVLITNGSGDLSWATAPLSAISADTFTATAGQTSFTLSHTPTGSAVMVVNGVTISSLAITVAGTTATYSPINNYSYALEDGDSIVITYIYSSTGATVATLTSISDTAISSPVQGQLLSYDATSSKWVNTGVRASAVKVARGTVVTLGKLKLRISTSGNVVTEIATTTGSMSLVGYGKSTHGVGVSYSSLTGTALTTTYATLSAAADLNTAGDTEDFTISDSLVGTMWTIKVVYLDNVGTASISIDRLN